MNKLILCLIAGLLLATTTPAWARVKLITLPVRQHVEVQLDHAQATLIEEERIVPLVKGRNQVDFSWANTAIDPGTIVFRVLGPADGKAMTANVIAMNYPPGENALVWDVFANRSGNVRVRISYLLGGLNKSFNYRAVVSADEKTLDLSQYLKVKNFANEAFKDTLIYAGLGDRFHQPIGLNQSREMLMKRYANVPVVKTFTCNLATYGYLDPAQQKLNVPMHYVLTNSDSHQLGIDPLPAGKVRLFQKDSQGTTAFLGEDWGTFTPLNNDMKLYLGQSQDIVVKRTVNDRKRTRVAGNLYRAEVVIKYEIENFKDAPATLNIEEIVNQLANEAGVPTGRPLEWIVGDQTTFTHRPIADETNLQHITYAVSLEPRQGDAAKKVVRQLHLIFKNVW